MGEWQPEQAATPQEADSDPAKPFAYYAAKLKELPASATEKTKRFVQFREAYWGMRAANAKPARGSPPSARCPTPCPSAT